MRKVFRKVFGRDIISKTAITIALAEHLLHQDTQSYIVDDRVKGKCICGCEVERKFGNTGIGLEPVWLGHINVLFSHSSQSSGVAVKSVPNSHVKRVKITCDRWDLCITDVISALTDEPFGQVLSDLSHSAEACVSDSA